MAYKNQPPSPQQERADLLALADFYLDLRKCPGGRYITTQYVCPHCGADPTDQPCKLPLKVANSATGTE